jgi:NADH dehydrogenase
LLTPLSYQRELADADTVVHLAAATGKVSVATHFRVNAEGTRVLLEQCQQSGVRRFVFVSSIATKYPDLRHYPYARAKLEAETAVVSSGLDFTIVRPTIIAGPGSSVLTALGRLASLPVVPIFGTGQVRVQPILVDDLADCLVSVIRDGLASCQTIELGGPEVITIEHLLGKLRHILTGKPMRHIRVPLAPLLPILALLETAVYRAMPVTVGQFSTFRFDGIASANPVFEQHYTRMTGLSRMIEVSFKP